MITSSIALKTDISDFKVAVTISNNVPQYFCISAFSIYVLVFIIPLSNPPGDLPTEIMCLQLIGAGPNPYVLTPLIEAVLNVIGGDSANLCGLDVIEGDTEK